MLLYCCPFICQTYTSGEWRRECENLIWGFQSFSKEKVKNRIVLLQKKKKKKWKGEELRRKSNPLPLEKQQDTSQFSWLLFPLGFSERSLFKRSAFCELFGLFLGIAALLCFALVCWKPCWDDSDTDWKLSQHSCREGPLGNLFFHGSLELELHPHSWGILSYWAQLQTPLLPTEWLFIPCQSHFFLWGYSWNKAAKAAECGCLCLCLAVNLHQYPQVAPAMSLYIVSFFCAVLSSWLFLLWHDAEAFVGATPPSSIPTHSCFSNATLRDVTLCCTSSRNIMRGSY